VLGIEQMILQELGRAFKMQGLNVNTAMFGDEVVITIPPEEIKNMILASIPQPFRNYVVIESGSIIVRIKLSFIGAIQ